MKHIRFFLVVAVFGILLTFPVLVWSQCPNLDFNMNNPSNMNNFSNWQAYAGSCLNGVDTIYPCQPIPGRHTIQRLTYNVYGQPIGPRDEYCDTIFYTPPWKFSAKLGNDTANAKINALEYTMLIDSSNSLLVVRFAFVLENPQNQSPNERPRFTIQIRDSSGIPLTNLAYSNIEFVADTGLQNLTCTGEIVARDWTTVGFNLDTFIGQTIKIYFETRDGTQGNHFGYAYIAAECHPIKRSFEYCYNGLSDARLCAPDGFAWYKWTSSSNSSWIREGKSSCTGFLTPGDGTVYTCQMTSDLDTNCIEFFVEFVHIILNANFALDYDTCNRTATFIDFSTPTPCEDYKRILWEIIDSNNLVLATSRDSLFTYTFPNPNDNKPVEYLVRLSIEVCACSRTYDGKWKKERNIIINHAPKDTILIFDRICQGDIYNKYGFNETVSGIYEQNLKNIYGCDSLVILNLYVVPKDTTLILDTICQGYIYNQYGFNETISGTYEQNLKNRFGCDSIVILNLYVASHDTLSIFDTIHQGDTYNKYGFNETVSGTYYQNLQNINGCDSLVILNLTISNVGIVVTRHATSLRIHPNPTNNQLHITMGHAPLSEDAVIEIYDISGKLISSFMSLQSLKTTIDISHLANGIYFLKANNQITKIIKQ